MEEWGCDGDAEEGEGDGEEIIADRVVEIECNIWSLDFALSNVVPGIEFGFSGDEGVGGGGDGTWRGPGVTTEERFTAPAGGVGTSLSSVTRPNE